MTENEKIALLEEIMDVEPGSLKADSVLEDFEEWDSLSKLAYAAMMTNKFKKQVTGEEIKAFVHVSDALMAMEQGE